MTMTRKKKEVDDKIAIARMQKTGLMKFETLKGARII